MIDIEEVLRGVNLDLGNDIANVIEDIDKSSLYKSNMITMVFPMPSFLDKFSDDEDLFSRRMRLFQERFKTPSFLSKYVKHDEECDD